MQLIYNARLHYNGLLSLVFDAQSQQIVNSKYQSTENKSRQKHTLFNLNFKDEEMQFLL